MLVKGATDGSSLAALTEYMNIQVHHMKLNRLTLTVVLYLEFASGYGDLGIPIGTLET